VKEGFDTNDNYWMVFIQVPAIAYQTEACLTRPRRVFREYSSGKLLEGALMLPVGILGEMLRLQRAAVKEAI